MLIGEIFLHIVNLFSLIASHSSFRELLFIITDTKCRKYSFQILTEYELEQKLLIAMFFEFLTFFIGLLLLTKKKYNIGIP
jgi:hypothetical protein